MGTRTAKTERVMQFLCSHTRSLHLGRSIARARPAHNPEELFELSDRFVHDPEQVMLAILEEPSNFLRSSFLEQPECPGPSGRTLLYPLQGRLSWILREFGIGVVVQ
jgi:hypothetical protein